MTFYRAGFMNAEGALQPEVIIAKLKAKAVLKDGNLEELIGKCIKELGDNDCSTAFKVYECYRGEVTYTHGHKHD